MRAMRGLERMAFGRMEYGRLLRRQPFPVAECQFAELRQHLQGHAVVCGISGGELMAAPERRGGDHFENRRRKSSERLLHLLHALRTERIVQRAAKHMRTSRHR